MDNWIEKMEKTGMTVQCWRREERKKRGGDRKSE